MTPAEIGLLIIGVYGVLLVGLLLFLRGKSHN